MKVSVALHTAPPDEDGNQREFEAVYRDYNRQYADLVEDPETGNGACEFDVLSFPTVPDSQQVFTHFSLGVCIAPADQGGAIIVAGPIDPPVVCPVGQIPSLTGVACGVRASRLAAMRADGRMTD